MRVVLYIRVSTLEQAKDGYSIGEQIDRLTKYCEAKGWIVYKIYTDSGYTGSDTKRPGLQSLIRDAEKHKFDAVLVYKLDRLSRSQKDTLTLIEDVFLPNDVNFISMTENFDTSTPFGRAMLGILSVFAQLEREQIKERMEVGKVGRAKEGKWCGSPNVPIGYNLGSDGELVINKYEAMQIQEMFRLFNLRISQRRVAKMLHNKGYTYQNGGTWAGKHFLRPMLENKHYIGMVSYKGEWFDGNQEAIIDMETFNKAQEILAERDADNGRESRVTSPLAGIVYCAHCGNKYFFRRASGKSTGDWTYYTCYKRTANTGKWKDIPKEERCKNKNWKAKELENKIIGEIRKLSLDPDSFVIEQTEDETADQRNIIENRIKEIDTQVSRFMDLYSIGGMDFNLVQEKINPLVEEKENLQLTLRDLEVKEDKMSKEEAVEIASSLCEIVDSSATDEIKFLIRELIEKIVIDEDKVHIYWKFA